MMITTGEVWNVSGKLFSLGKSYITSDAAQIQSCRLHSSFYPHLCTRHLWAYSWVIPPTCKEQATVQCHSIVVKNQLPNWQTGPDWWRIRTSDANRSTSSAKRRKSWAEVYIALCSARRSQQTRRQCFVSSKEKSFYFKSNKVWRGRPWLWRRRSRWTGHSNDSTAQNRTEVLCQWIVRDSVKMYLYYNALISLQ